MSNVNQAFLRAYLKNRTASAIEADAVSGTVPNSAPMHHVPMPSAASGMPLQVNAPVMGEPEHVFQKHEDPRIHLRIDRPANNNQLPTQPMSQSEPSSQPGIWSPLGVERGVKAIQERRNIPAVVLNGVPPVPPQATFQRIDPGHRRAATNAYEPQAAATAQAHAAQSQLAQPYMTQPHTASPYELQQFAAQSANASTADYRAAAPSAPANSQRPAMRAPVQQFAQAIPHSAPMHAVASANAFPASMPAYPDTTRGPRTNTPAVPSEPITHRADSASTSFSPPMAKHSNVQPMHTPFGDLVAPASRDSVPPRAPSDYNATSIYYPPQSRIDPVAKFAVPPPHLRHAPVQPMAMPDAGPSFERTQAPSSGHFETTSASATAKSADAIKSMDKKATSELPLPVAFAASWEVDQFFWPEVVNKLKESNPEAFRQIGRHLVTANQSGLKVMAITSGERGVGRSTVAMHMARCAAAAGLKVALVDADTFCPNLIDQLRLDVEHGWQACLFENVPLQETAVHSIADNITFFPLTTIVSPQQVHANLLRISKLIRRITTAFDIVFLDANRINLEQRDLVGVSQETIVDAAIVVVDTELSIKEKVDSAVSILQEMGIASIGLVENFQAS